MNTAPAERRLRLDLAYDGTDFEGWQAQARGRTVQRTVEAAFSQLLAGAPVTIRAAGRTDAGVHAVAQVADVDVRTGLSDLRIATGLAHLLPSDIRPLAVTTVDSSFDAQRDAIAKTYVYRLDRSRYGDPLRRRWFQHEPYPLDLLALDAALSRIQGRHDFSSFTASACRVRSRERTILEARFEVRDPTESWFMFRADGFLTHMVRNLVGTLLAVARGRIAPEDLSTILAAKDRRRAGPTAPPRGLCLWRVEYPILPGGAKE